MQRKNCWQMAEAVGEQDPQPLQRLLYSARWDADEVPDELQRFVVEQFGDEAAIGVVDETGFLKKGTKSVGVKRQYAGTAGKVENSQDCAIHNSALRSHLVVFTPKCTALGGVFQTLNCLRVITNSVGLRGGPDHVTMLGPI